MMKARPASRHAVQRAPHGLTLVEVLIVIAVLSVIAGLLVPALAAARENARAADCRDRLHQMTMALRMYADDYDGLCPPPLQWDRLLVQQMRVQPPYSCPGVRGWYFNPHARRLPGDYMAGYAINSYLLGLPIRPRLRPSGRGSLDPIPYPATTVAFVDARARMLSTMRPDVGKLGGWEEGGRRHRGEANYAFLDGHVKWYRPEAVDASTVRPTDGTRPAFRPN